MIEFLKLLRDLFEIWKMLSPETQETIKLAIEKGKTGDTSEIEKYFKRSDTRVNVVHKSSEGTD